MAPGDFQQIAGRQRAVVAQPGGHVVVSTTLEHFEAMVIESGTAVLEDYFMLNDDVTRRPLRIPIMVVPAGANVVKTVAHAAPASFGWNSDADSAIWAVDEVSVEEDTGTRDLFLVAQMATGGEECGLVRIAYHITVLVQSRRYIADPNAIAELDTA